MALCSIAVAAGVVGVFTVVKGLFLRRRFAQHAFAGGACGFGSGDFGRWHRARRGFWRGGIGRSFWLRAIFAKLDTTPGQEREIHAALEELRERAFDAKSGLGETRANIGRAVAGDFFDESAYEAASARADATGEKVKDALASALKRIHAVLDGKQRERLAELIAQGGFAKLQREGGPYRGGAEI